MVGVGLCWANFFYSFIIMWLVWLAIIILGLLVLFNYSREGINSAQLYDVQKIMNSSKTPDEKFKALYGESASVTIDDPAILAILKDSTAENEEKINNLKTFFIKLVDERNNNEKSIYLNVPDKIISSTLFAMNDIIYNNDYDSPDKIAAIKNLNIQEPTFSNIINNNSISDSVKIFGDPEGNYKEHTLSSLINQVLFSTFADSSLPPPPSK